MSRRPVSHLNLLAMPLAEITPLHLNREWNRLLKAVATRGGTRRRGR